MNAPPRALSIGRLFVRRYQIGELLGRGGSGVVYRAYDHQRKSEVALKIHAPRGDGAAGPEWSWRMRREFYLMAQLSHPHIVRVHDWGEDGEQLYFTMDLIEGQDVAEMGRLPVAEVLALLVPLASALGFVHGRGYVHQDVKPRNIRLPGSAVAADGARDLGRALLMDFGLLAPLGGGPIGDRVAGTPGYVAPEVLVGGAADARSDLYSLGVTAHVLLSGILPARPGQLDPGRFPEPLPRPVELLLRSLMASDPRERPVDAAELLERLAPLTSSRVSVEQLAPAYLATPPLICRGGELATLRQAWARVVDGRGGTVYVVAAAGLGKSHLLRAFSLELMIAGAQVIEARGREEARVPFSLLQDLLAPLWADPLLRRSAPAEAGPALAELLEGSRAGAGNPDEERRRIRRALIAWLRVLPIERPLVLLVDDLHWGDTASVDALQALFRELVDRPVLLLAGVRTSAAFGEEQAERLRRGALAVLWLQPFTPADLDELIRALFARTQLSRRLVEQIYAASGGNPYLAVELARRLVERGLATFEAGRWSLPRDLAGLELPRTLEEALADRLELLSPPARRLADALAVIGTSDGQTLGALAGLEEQGLFPALDELAVRQVARAERAGVGFLHPRLHEVVLGAMSLATQEELHRRSAELLEHRFATAHTDARRRADLHRRIGHHLARSGAEVELRAVAWLQRAGDAAFRIGDWRDAVSPLSEAATILLRHGGPDVHPVLLDIWEQLGQAARAHDPELSTGVFRRLRDHLGRHGSWQKLAARSAVYGPRLAVARGLLSAALTGLREEGLRGVRGSVREATRFALVTGYLSLGQMIQGELEEAREGAEILDAFAGAARGEAPLAFARMARAGWSFAVGQFEEGIALAGAAAELVERDRTLSDFERRRIVAEARLVQLWTHGVRADRAFPAAHDRFAALADGLEIEDFQVYSAMTACAYHGMRGDLTRLEEARARYLQRCFQLHGTWWEAVVLPATTPLLAEAGLWARVRDDLRSFSTLVPAGPYREIWSRILEGVLLAARGEHRAGANLLDEAVARADAREVRSDFWAARALAFSAEAWLADGVLDVARSRARDLLRRSQASPMRFLWAEARAERLLGQVALRQGRADEARQLAAASMAVAEVADHPGERAHARLLEAEAALAVGVRARAMDLAGQAESGFLELGNGRCARLAAEVVRLAAPAGAMAAGVTVPRRPPAADGDTVLDDRGETLGDLDS